MAVMTWTRNAKCKDCRFLKVKYIGNKKLHECELTGKHRTLNDLVCDDWKL
jgi:hypothetical protein